MKNLKNIFFLTSMIAVMASCESDNERYSGTPVGNQEFVTVDAIISSPISSALTNQDVPFTVQLVNKTFADTVTVEVTTLNKGGGRTRVSVDIMPGATTTPMDKIHEIPAAGGAIFNTSFDMYVSGIALKKAEPGKHYLVKSNVLVFGTGSTTIPSDDTSALQLKFAWFNASSSRNNFKVFVDRPNVSSYNSSPGATNSGTTVTVSDTSGLMPGMAVTVSSGSGAFSTNTLVAAVTGPTTFTVTQAPSAANTLGNNAVVTAGGNDYTSTDATSVGTSNLVDVPSTAGLYVGMPVFVTSGTGKFKNGTTVAEIMSPTRFRISNSFVTPGGTPLSNANISAVFPDVFPVFNGTVSHDISINPGQSSGGTSTPEGDYYIKFLPISVLTSGADVPYRIVWKRPNGSVDFYEGVFTAATLSTPSKTVLKVTKSGTGSGASFTIAPL